MTILKVNGKLLIATDVNEADRLSVLARQDVRAMSQRAVYIWNCETQKGKFLGQTSPAKPPPDTRSVVLPNIVVAHEYSQATNAKPNKTASEKMTRNTMKKLYFNKTAEMRAKFNRILLLSRKKVPLDKFSYLNRFVTYVIEMKTTYEMVRLINKGEGINIVVLIPHQVSFSARILEYCATPESGKDSWDALLGAEKGILDKVHSYFAPGGLYNNILRRRSVRKRILDLERKLEETSGDKEKEKIRRKIKDAVGEMKRLKED